MRCYDKQSNMAPRARGEQLPVTAAIDVRSIGVNTEEMKLAVAFNLTLLWRDDRLSYFNLKHDQRLNPLIK